MRSNLKKMSFVVLIIFCTAFVAYPDDTPLQDLQDMVTGFSGNLAKSLPFNASIGLNWSDAYIGKFFPSLPPHFGVGVTLGATTMDMPALQSVASMLGYDIPDSIAIFTNKMPLPAYAAEARIGGLFLPFDVGVKYGIIPPLDLFGVKMNYTLFGADLRWAVLDLPILKVSAGAGLNYLEGGIGATAPLGTDFSIDGVGTLAISDPEINLLWKTTSLEAKAQVSIPLLIITPYAGIGVGYAWSEAGYEVKTTITYTDTSSNPQDIDEAILEQINTALGGNTPLSNLSDTGFSSIVPVEGWAARIFAGLSVNLTIVRLDLNLMYNFLDEQFGATFGVRVQL